MVCLTSSHASSVTIASSTSTRLKYLAGRIHELGPYVLYQLMCEAGNSPNALARFEAYAQIDQGILRAYGGDKLPPKLRVVK